MTETITPSGQTEQAPVVSSEQAPNQPVVDPAKTVSYDTHRQLLSEKKKLAEQLAVIQGNNKEREEAELRQKEDWKTLLETRDQELDAVREELGGHKSRTRDARKIDRFLNTLDAKLDSKYWVLIDLEAIAINPDTEEVDDMSVTKAVETFRSRYAETLYTKTGVKVPQSAPAGSSAPRNLNQMSSDELGSMVANHLLEGK